MSVVNEFRRGYTLITTMLVMIVLFVIGAAGAMLVYYGNMTSGAMINYSKAYYNADYGLQQVAYNVMNGACNCTNNGCGISQTLPTGGTVQVITQSDANNKTCFIESIGTGQTGGEVARAITVSTGGSNWAAFGIMNGFIGTFGSGSINGCDTQDTQDACQAAGILYGGNAIIIGSSTSSCQSAPNNTNGIYGNPATQLTNATNVAQLITPFSSLFSNPNLAQLIPPLGSFFSNSNSNSNSNSMNNYITTQMCSYFYNTTQCNFANTPTQNQSCYCNGNAIASNGTITCNNLTSSTNLATNCNYYYISGMLTVNSTTFGENQVVYANDGINITGNNLSISGGLLDTPGISSINTLGNSTIGYPNPTTLLSRNTSINMLGTSNIINGLILTSNLGEFQIGNATINGAIYANRSINLEIGNASINFNYATLSQIASTYPNLFNPVNCYGNGTQQSMLNAVTLY
jgi:hypothetical protein